MSDEVKKPVATQSQRKFYAELQKKSNERYQKQNSLQAQVNKMKEDIAIATIGYGKAITIMSDRVALLEKDLQSMKENPLNIDLEFKEKFGVSAYSLDKIYG